MISFEQLVPENGHIIGEIACGHDGDPDKLKQLIDCVVEGGVQLIKFQLFSVEERAVRGEKAWDIFCRLELNEEQWSYAVNYARGKGLFIISDVYGEYSFSLAKRLEVDGFKIHSEDLLNSYFIAQVAKEKKLLFISVGAAHRVEIYNLLSFLKGEDLLHNVVLMTGVQTFPTPLEAHSLEEVSDLIDKYSRYGVKVGFSDHIAGDQEEAKIVPLMALAKGACVIEKHVTLNREDKWTDYHSSLSKTDFKQFVLRVQKLSPLLLPIASMSEDEKKYRKMFKKSPALKRDISKGCFLKSNDIEFKKDTENAIPLASLNIAGKSSACDISKGEILRTKYLKQKIGIIIVARYTSDRLPGKAIRKIAGRESIAHVIGRMKRCKNVDCVILATSTDPTDDVLVEIAEREGVPSFRGSLDNVALRYFEASRKFGLDHFVRVTGDALLCDETMVDKAVESHLNSSCEVTFMRNMPFGTHKEIVSINAIRTIVEMSEQPHNTEYLEYFLENDRYFSVNYVDADYEFDPQLRLTLDYEEDLEFLDNIYKHFHEMGNPDFLLRDALKWLGENPEIANINMHKTQKFDMHQTRNFFSEKLNVRLKI